MNWHSTVGARTLVSVVVVALPLTAGACGGDNAGGADGSAATGDSGQQKKGPDVPEKLRIGESVSVEGSYDLGSGTKRINVAAAIVRVEDPATTDTPPGEIQAGRRWIRATVRLKNKGPSPYDIDQVAPASFKLVDRDGQEYVGNDVTPVGPAPQLSGTVLPGESTKGALVFLVPVKARAKDIRWEPLVGQDVAARWIVGARK